MTRLQWATIIVAIVGVFVLYFGFDTKSTKEKSDLKQVEKEGISIDIQPLIESAKGTLSSTDEREITSLENRTETEEGPEKMTALKELSGKWYRLAKPHIAGYYAEEVAEMEKSGEAWSIAATTYVAGIGGSSEPFISDWCLNKAIAAFENAISLDPEVSQYRVNLALLYAEKPPTDDPMKGVQMLLSMNEKDPDDVLVLNALARLAIKTGQWERAKDRLLRADSLQPDNITTVCLLATVYQELNDEQAQATKDKCELLTSKR
ncbi:MAG: hypothetical protein KDC80_25215 [Saprospiraceae bacterium]|nr:hypothetical protein [Saprospiraceae bacterium]